MKNNKYTEEQIRMKSFTTELKGYKVEEIEEFMDEIQMDYAFFIEQIKKLRNDNKTLTETNKSMTDELAAYKIQTAALKSERDNSLRNDFADSNVIHKVARMEETLNAITKQLKELNDKKN